MAHCSRVAKSIMTMAFGQHSPSFQHLYHRRELRTMAITLSRKLNPMAHVMVRPSPACPPEFLRKMHRGILATEFGSITSAAKGRYSEEVRTEEQRSSVVIFGAGRVGNYLPDQIIPLFDVKNIIIVDKNQENCKALFEKVKTRFPTRTSVLGIVSDVTHPGNVEEALQKAVSHSNGLLDVIIDAINLTKEENSEDAMTPLTATLVKFQQQCLGKLKPRGQFANFDSAYGLPPSLYDDSTVRHVSLSRSVEAPEVKTSSYIKDCVEKIADTRHQRTPGKVMFTFARPPRLIDE